MAADTPSPYFLFPFTIFSSFWQFGNKLCKVKVHHANSPVQNHSNFLHRLPKKESKTTALRISTWPKIGVRRVEFTFQPETKNKYIIYETIIFRHISRKQWTQVSEQIKWELYSCLRSLPGEFPECRTRRGDPSRVQQSPWAEEIQLRVHKNQWG